MTQVYTVSNEQMVQRCHYAAGTLLEGKKVVLLPGIFRASGWEPKHVLEHVLYHLRDWYPEETWVATLVRRPDGAFVLQGRMK